ncbi:4-hydroxyphenylpyruvate dioxygenase [Streptomyces sp. SD11]|uniref:4-hydroxyphenylpyruvate dioxygenase n=1 Tax=unclassified Streptomyces TaxID=2593676 RepID=UPI0020101B66|nr:4-hydroxyphenylpyruvate dioxygenase [Streptomyces sp. LRE541]UPZ32771.1 4-hydroxyphenylpyruvate dioxygenase [Streptomyces sp. LRE541]
MTVHDMAHVELYTSHAPSTIDYFVSGMGFTRVADRVEADRSSILLRQGETRLIVTSGRGIWKFLDQHGDGIADIALTCDDVTKTRDAAVAAGAETFAPAHGNPVVSAFGGVTHTLLPRPSEPEAWPPGRAWEAAPQAPGVAAGRVRLLDHIAVCVEGSALEDYADYYDAAFGMSRYSSEYVAVGDQAMDSIVVRSESGRVTFTLVAPDPTKSPGQLDAFLDRNGGPGVQHLAFLVDEIIPAVRELRDQGVEFLSTPGTYYDMLADRFTGMREKIEELRATQILADRDEWGYLLQLFSRSPYERNTLFFELIQRRGSRGFGSANIRALYEAVERDRLAAG